MAKSIAAAPKNSKADKVNKKEKKVVESPSSASESESEASSSSSSDSSDSEEEEKEEKKNESSDSDSDSDSDDEEKATAESANSSDSESSKRKAEAEETPAAKKTKTEEAPASATVFVGGLSWNVDNDWLRTEFTECGEILDVRVITDRDTQRSKGFAYVEFATAEGANAALALAGKDIDGRAIRVDLSEARPKKEAGAAKSFNNAPTGDASDTLFVGNLSFNATEDDLRGAFAECGEIISVRLPTDRET
ncbi:hypothetical protein BG000_004553, partial [Podila horticola]